MQQDLIETRSDLKTAVAAREQPEEWLRTTARLPHSESSLARKSRRKRPGGKSKRPSQPRPLNSAEAVFRWGVESG
jgi:hypothetical protein